MFKYRLDIAYDGKEFLGSQIQPQKRTVEGEIRKQLLKFCDFQNLVFSGRTDAGVHAKHQVLSFESSLEDISKINKALSSLLPEDIALNNVEKVSLDFDARYSAISRSYCYFIKTIETSHPIDRLSALIVNKPLDLDLLNKVSQIFLGENDFMNFSKNRDNKNTLRTITEVGWKEKDNKYEFYISGNSFLWEMVRTIIGSLLALNDMKINENHLKSYLSLQQTERMPYVAPPQGLYLWKVQY